MDFCIDEEVFVIDYDTDCRTCPGSYLLTACPEAGHEGRESAKAGSRPGHGNAYRGLSVTLNSEVHRIFHLVKVQCHLCCNQEILSVGEPRC